MFLLFSLLDLNSIGPYSDTLTHNLNSELDWVNYTSSHLLPAMNWTLLQQNMQKENVEIDHNLLQLKLQTDNRRNNKSSASTTVVSSSEEDFNFEIE